jgi:hypothetical protein
MTSSAVEDMASVDMALTMLKVCADEGARERLGVGRSVNVVALARPGTLVWVDPMTHEERYTAPGDRMYSTALMFAEEAIGADGLRHSLFGE